jgi:Flp pilus assembly protein TadB
MSLRGEGALPVRRNDHVHDMRVVPDRTPRHSAARQARERRYLTMGPDKERRRKEYERGLDDYHDPTAGIGGAPPARSALTLRAVLAAFGLVFCAGAAWISFAAGWPLVGWVLVVVAVIALVDLVVVLNRKRRGEPG